MIPSRLISLAARVSALCIALGIASCVSRRTGFTSLANPLASFAELPAPSVEISWGDAGDGKPMRATLATNEAIGADHKAGYNGLIDLRCGDGPSPFVPAYAGLNLEHVLNGVAWPDRDLQFEPRRRPMRLLKIDDATYELYQAPLPNTGLESCTRFEFKPPNIIDVTFECVPRRDAFPHGYLDLFWASYIQQPKQPQIWFRGRKKGERGERWIEAYSPKHGEASTHRAATDRRQHTHDSPFPLTLVFNESEYEYTLPFYYGLHNSGGEKTYVWSVMFDPRDNVRLAQSPTGGGDGNPAWDFHWFIDRPKVGKLYRLRYRATFKEWNGRPDDLLADYESYARSRGIKIRSAR